MMPACRTSPSPTSRMSASRRRSTTGSSGRSSRSTRSGRAASSAARIHVASACVRPATCHSRPASLRGTDVAVGTVIGFPHGSHHTATKVFEVGQALADGATELDMVINIGWLRSGEHRRRRGRHPCGRRGHRWPGAGQGHPRERLSLEGRDRPRVEGGRGGRRRLREDVDRVRAIRWRRSTTFDSCARASPRGCG